MLIDSITIASLEIPFRESFKHASAERTKTQAVLVTAISGDVIGYGEGCPREYVTNESIASSITFFDSIKSEILAINSLDDLEKWIANNSKQIDQNPACWCAIEIAILDLLAKQQKVSIERLLGLPELAGDFQYSAIVGDSSIETTTKHVKKYAAIGFKDFKVKITGDPIIDNEKLSVIANQLSDGYRIRLDANNLWNSTEEFGAYYTALKHSIFAIEEPLQKDNYSGLESIIATHNIKIVLDESFTNIHDFEKLVSVDNYMINLRISKMGGMLRAKQICEEATKRNIPIIIGAQVGETSILTRCAITMANAFRNILVAQEGAYGLFLLENDVTKKPIMFGQAGIVKAKYIQTDGMYGVGVEVESDYQEV